MNLSRIAVLGIALVAGIAAFFLVMGNTPEQPEIRIVEPVKEETVRVLVSTRDVQRGERLTLEDTSWIVWPKKALQQHFITDETPARREELVSAVARSLIVTGEPLVDAKVVKAGNSGLMAAIISPGMRAVTMRVSPETSSGGFVLPGDRVDVFKMEGGTAKVMFEEVRVLAVNTNYSENNESASLSATNVTLELSQRDAQAFLTARSTADMNIVLRSIFKPKDDEVEDRRSSDVNIIRYGRS